MANYKASIQDVVTGTDISVFITLDNVGVGQTLVQGWLTVKEEEWDDDVSAIFQKIITTTPVLGQGHIQDDGAGDSIAVLLFEFTRADTLLLHPYFEYVYDIKVKTSTNKEYIPEKGTLIAEDSITDAV